MKFGKKRCTLPFIFPLLQNSLGAMVRTHAETRASPRVRLCSLTWGSTLAGRWLYQPPADTAPGFADARPAGPLLSATLHTAPHVKEKRCPETAPQRRASRSLDPGGKGSVAQKFRTHSLPESMAVQELSLGHWSVLALLNFLQTFCFVVLRGS